VPTASIEGADAAEVLAGWGVATSRVDELRAAGVLT
jgi:hypothetical protein